MISKELNEALAPMVDNPFYVLGLKTDATRAEIERQGQKLLDQLDLGVSSAKMYATPLGPRERALERVRWAMAELRDPQKRLAHEAWAKLPVREKLVVDEALAPAEDAFAAMGF